MSKKSRQAESIRKKRAARHARGLVEASVWIDREVLASFDKLAHEIAVERALPIVEARGVLIGKLLSEGAL